jgi:hypothetical protein
LNEEHVMSGDYSRNTFDAKKHFSSVLMQQGRVQLDADWNELAEIIDRRWRAETTDIIGRAVVPKETPDGFKIQIAGGTLAIGRGRMYVHGLLAENHGGEPWEFDSVLAEERGTAPIRYADQPYFPNPPALPAGGPHLVYLDVWRREVTYLEKPALIEKAVGVDTTTRQQTVWQVKILANVGTAVTCATADDQIPGWLEQTRPSAGRLTTAVVNVPSTDNPCLIPPTGGYKGLENQLYRIEIHAQGGSETATFKWSRDNATVATAVTAIPALDTLTVVRTGRDSLLRFNPGDWLEITDDWRELAGLPGEMRKIASIDDALRTIILTTPLSAGTFPTNAQGQTDSARHTRIRRWDQNGKERVTSGNPVVDLDAKGGVIPVPAAGIPIILENGVQITFTTDPAGGNFRVGDYWVFAARTADASVEQLEKAPPLGIHHHYARLALVTFPATVTDCRVLWPPDAADKGCDCTVCVTTESHNAGTQTIQRAIDQVKRRGGTVCLDVGNYNLSEETIRIAEARSVRLKGQGRNTRLLYRGAGAAVVIEESRGVVLEDMCIQHAGQSDTPRYGVLARNSAEVILRRCIIEVDPQESGGIAVGLGGYLVETFIQGNQLSASTGIGSFAERGEQGQDNKYRFTAGLYIQDNVLACDRKGISLEQASFLFAEAWLSGNSLSRCAESGIAVLGTAFPNARVNVFGNVLRVRGRGIVIGTGVVRVSSNDVGPFQEGESGDGIVLDTGFDPDGVVNCQILDNRISDIAGRGIVLRTRVQSAMIKQNVIKSVGGGGIITEEKGSADVLSVENNQLLDLGPRIRTDNSAAVGILLRQVTQATVASNTISGIGTKATAGARLVGIGIVACAAVRIVGNEIVDVGPAQEFLRESGGILVFSPFDRVDVADNVVRRTQQLPDNPDTKSDWYALFIQGSKTSVQGGPITVSVNLGENLEYVHLPTATMLITKDRLFTLPHGQEVVAAHGNLLEAHGANPAVAIRIAGDCTFNDNRCQLFPSAANGIVGINAASFIASANYVRGRSDIAMDLQAALKKFTVLGNVTDGRIFVNGSLLDDPWKPLNVSS